MQPSLHSNGRSWILLKHQSQQNSLQARQGEQRVFQKNGHGTLLLGFILLEEMQQILISTWGWGKPHIMWGSPWLKPPVLTGRQKGSSPGMQQYLDISTSWRPKAVPGLKLTAPTKVRGIFVLLFLESETQASARPQHCPHLSRQKGQPRSRQLQQHSQLCWASPCWNGCERNHIELRPSTVQGKHLRTPLKVLVWSEGMTWRNNIWWDGPMRSRQDCMGRKEPRSKHLTH